MTFDEAYERAQKLKLRASFAHAREAATRGEESEQHRQRAERLENEARKLMEPEHA